jgi:hypothetical protein
LVLFVRSAAPVLTCKANSPCGSTYMA